MREVSVAFLWHMHQPYYKDPVLGSYQMPWVRLHSVRGYNDMCTLLGEFPDVRCTFNLVPSLIVQIMDYAEKGCRDVDFLLSMKSPDDLTWDEKRQVVLRFFMCSEQTMIAPFPRYLNLFRKRGRLRTAEDLDTAAREFSDQDILDLQVLFNLTWTGFMARKDPGTADLIRRGRGFTEGDKRYLLDRHIDIMKGLLPAYKRLFDNDQIDISTSPFYHPIGPLVMNVGYALRSMDSPLPDEPFAHPEDLDAQIARAVSCHETVFGNRPKGLWPPEGSVCPEMVELMARHGFTWAATDEDILFASIGQSRTGSLLYQPYRAASGDAEVSLFFRDRPLSDCISFIYAKNPPEQAVGDFMHHLGNIFKAARGADHDPVVSVILDGENPWEYYPDGGEGFLRGLYERLSGSDEIRTVQFREYLEGNPPRNTIRSLYTGSWINRNFRIWIGHEDDRRAWELLARTRGYVESKGSRAHPLAWEEIYIAEGSDWYWWYGDEFTTDNDEEFDRIFRNHLRNCYDLHGDAPPEELSQSIITPHDITPLKMPEGFVSPILDGTVSHFYEWRKAGCYQPSENAKSMYKHIQHLSAIYFGFDAERFHLRVDFPVPPKDAVITLHVVHPRSLQVRMPVGSASMTLYREEGARLVPERDLSTVAYRDILEMSIPFRECTMVPSRKMRFFVSVLKDELEVERHPVSGLLSITVPDKSYERVMWHV